MTERMKRFFEAAVKNDQSLETLKDLNNFPSQRRESKYRRWPPQWG